MSCCLLCGVESLVDNLLENQLIKETEIEIYDLIHLYLPFCDVSFNSVFKIKL